MIVDAFIQNYMTRITRRNFRLETVNRTFIPTKKHKSRLIYIHIPFCEEFCHYCSFHKIKWNDFPAATYFEALKAEIKMYKERGFSFDSVYIGGGTPTLAPENLRDIIALVYRFWEVKNLSVETNPNHITPNIIQMLNDCGVNRLSIGVQSFSDDLLKKIGRFERFGSGKEIAEKIKTLHGRFKTVNIDMMFNFPMQSEYMLRYDLDMLEKIVPDQITYYPLMSSKENREYSSVRRERKFYDIITSRLDSRYLNSTAWCFSRKTGMIDEYIVTNDEFAGLGVGSFGYTNGIFYMNYSNVSQYIETINKGRMPIVAMQNTGLKNRVRLDLLLRLFGGELKLSYLHTKYGLAPLFLMWKEVVFFYFLNSISYRKGAFRLNKKGRYHWIIMMREFFNSTNSIRQIAHTFSEKK